MEELLFIVTGFMWGEYAPDVFLPGYWETGTGDCPATTPQSYLTENLASMSFSRAIIRAVKGPTVAGRGKTDLSRDLTEIRERRCGLWEVGEVGEGEG